MQRRILGEIQSTFIPSSIISRPTVEELLDKLVVHSEFIDIEAGSFDNYPLDVWPELIEHIEARIGDMNEILYKFEGENVDPRDLTPEAVDILSKAAEAIEYAYNECQSKLAQIGRNVRRRGH